MPLTQEQQTAVRKGEPIPWNGLALYPILVEDYDKFSIAKTGITAQQQTLPGKYVVMRYLEALFALDYDVRAAGGPEGGLFSRVLLLLTLSLRLEVEKGADGREYIPIGIQTAMDMHSVSGKCALFCALSENHTIEMPDQPTVYTNCRIKEYPKSLVKQVATGAIFPMIPGASKPRSYAVSRPGHAKDQERSIKMSQQRAKSKVRDLALCNMDTFDTFLTWTIDPDLLDRYDPKAVYQKLRTFLGNAVHRKEFSYLLVPEYHKKKAGEDRPAIHLHGLCHLGKVRVERARDKLGHRRTDKEGRPVFNMLDWKYGFSTCIPLDENYERTANYVAKYITKGNGGKIFGKWYLHSRDLVKGPNTYPHDPENYDEFRDEEKLKAHIQHEGEIYNGLRVLSEEFPKI